LTVDEKQNNAALSVDTQNEKRLKKYKQYHYVPPNAILHTKNEKLNQTTQR
jgi:hypothetical protein